MNRNSLKYLIGLAVAILLVVSPLIGAENVELEKAKSWFRQGEIQEAAALLQRLVSTETLSKEDRVEALEFLAFCNIAKQQDSEVQTSFTRILKIDSAYKPRETYLSHPAVMRGWLSARKEVLGNYWSAASKASIKTIAIMDFDNNSLEGAETLANLGKGLADLLITDLASLTDLKVVEREQVQFIMDEIQRSDSRVEGRSLVDPQFAVQIGKLLGAQSTLLGSYMKVGKKLRIDVRIVRTETSEIIKTDHVEGSEDEILKLAKKLAIKISENLEVAINKVEDENLERIRQGEIPLEAAMAYSEALNMLDKERYNDAQKMLSKALKIAPNFRMAQEKLTVLAQFQKS